MRMSGSATDFGYSDNVNFLAENLSSLFSTFIEKHAFLGQVRVSERYCLWVNVSIKSLIAVRKIKSTPG